MLDWVLNKRVINVKDTYSQLSVGILSTEILHGKIIIGSFTIIMFMTTVTEIYVLKGTVM